MKRREFLKTSALGLTGLLTYGCQVGGKPRFKQAPNILFCIADDWGWPHAGALGDPVVKTPTFDRLVREGVLFEHAYVSSPSCTPCRNSILTGQHHWRLGEGANLHSTLDINIPVYPLLLEEAGYHVGRWRKSFGPGNLKAGGYTDTHPAGKNFKNGFKQFLDARPAGKPFCFWLGASDPHRGYDKGSGKASGIPVENIRVPGFYPDAEDIRSDIADYYFEVQRFDQDCGEALKLLEDIGELDNTLIVMTGDHGMPFPRCKGNCYDMGVRVPMALRFPTMIPGNRQVTDFMSLIDLAPTFLKAAGVTVPAQMIGRSLWPTLMSSKQGRVDKKRDHMIFGRERHTPAQKAPSIAGYPVRGIRTDQYLYLHNIAPDRWPAGVPEGASHPMNQHADCDNGPTKSYLMDNRNDPHVKRYYNLSFAQRPAEELYDVTEDPYQLTNLVLDPKFAKIKDSLAKQLTRQLKKTEDPRIIGDGEAFDRYPYRAGYKLNKG